jgi:hypothetical protein
VGVLAALFFVTRLLLACLGVLGMLFGGFLVTDFAATEFHGVDDWSLGRRAGRQLRGPLVVVAAVDHH